LKNILGLDQKFRQISPEQKKKKRGNKPFHLHQVLMRSGKPSLLHLRKP